MKNDEPVPGTRKVVVAASPSTPPPFVAHRGDPLVYPENTLCSALAAIAAGTCYLEVDIQLTADLVPVLYHDGRLERLSATAGEICTTALPQLQRHGAFHPSRFEQKHRGTPIATLYQLLSQLQGGEAQAFIELKRESLQHFGRALVLDQVKAVTDQCGREHVAAVISKDDMAIERARDRIGGPIGWVLPAWDESHQRRAEQLAPEFLFCNQHRLPASSANRWHGSWRWVVYTVNEPNLAQQLLHQGIDLIETDRIGTMISAWSGIKEDRNAFQNGSAHGD